jgi:hypothetical protein
METDLQIAYHVPSVLTVTATPIHAKLAARILIPTNSVWPSVTVVLLATPKKGCITRQHSKALALNLHMNAFAQTVFT